MSIKDFIGVDPNTPYNPFAHDSDPETRTLFVGGKCYHIDLDPRERPMRADLTDAQGNDIARVKGIAALLAYVAEWNAGTGLLDLSKTDGALSSPHELFHAYYYACLMSYRNSNAASYKSYEAAGLTDRVQQLDDTFRREHVQEEADLLPTAAQTDTLLFGGHLSPVAEEYLQWVELQGKKPQNTGEPAAGQPDTPRTIDTDGLKSYFQVGFYNARNGSINWFETLVENLKVDRSAKDFARIALLIYEGGWLLTAKRPATFKGWYNTFCTLVGIQPKTYDPNKIRDGLKGFDYLMK